jgi:hypothetical protein
MKNKTIIKCEDCGKTIKVNEGHKAITHQRCLVCLDPYLYKKDFEARLNSEKEQ